MQQDLEVNIKTNIVIETQVNSINRNLLNVFGLMIDWLFLGNLIRRK